MTDLLPRVEIGPECDARGSIVWLHGLGADGHDFAPLVPYLELPDVRFVFPHAPVRAVTINMGLVMPAWYDIRSLEDPPPAGEDERGVRASGERIVALLEGEERRGVPSTRTVLAGFSQGGALALHVGTRYPRPLAGIMVLSGAELLEGTRDAEEVEANRLTPMLFCHGTRDPLVPLSRSRRAFDAHARGRPAEWHAFPMAHEVCDEEIRVIRDWLHARLGSSPPPRDGPEPCGGGSATDEPQNEPLRPSSNSRCLR